MIPWQGAVNHWLSQDSQKSVSGDSTSDRQSNPEDLSPWMKQALPDASRRLQHSVKAVNTQDSVRATSPLPKGDPKELTTFSEQPSQLYDRKVFFIRSVMHAHCNTINLDLGVWPDRGNQLFLANDVWPETSNINRYAGAVPSQRSRSYKCSAPD